MLLALQHDARAPPMLDVLKVAHHGSANRDDGLLALAHAPVAVVSVGADNDYGHPAPSTLSALAGTAPASTARISAGDIAVRQGDDGSVEVATMR